MRKSFKKICTTIAILSTLTHSGLAMLSATATSNIVTVEITEEEEEAFKNEPASKEKIQVAYNGGTCTGILGVALTKGFYAEEGLDVEIIQVESTKDALGTGKADVSGGHITTNVIPMANGMNYTAVTGMHTGCKSLYVFTESGIESTADLIGKTVAVPEGIGSSDQNIAYRFFKYDDLDPSRMNYKQVESGATVQALESGEIHAAILTDQFAYSFVQEGKLKAIRSITTDEDFKHQTCCADYINNDFIKANPVAAQKITRALQRTREWVVAHPDEFVDELLANNWTTGDREVIIDYVKTLDYAVSDEATEATFKSIIKDYKEFGFIKDDLSDEEILEMVWSPQN